MKSIFLLTTRISLILILFSNSIYAQSIIGEASLSYKNCDYRKSIEKYSIIWNAENSSSEELVLSGRRLAYLSWKVARDIKLARKYISGCIENVQEKIPLILELSKYELEARNFTEAKKIIQEAKGIDKNNTYSNQINNLIAYIALEKATLSLEKGLIIEENEVREALKLIKIINKEDPGQLDVCEIQLGLALIVGDWHAAFSAWKGYFRSPLGAKTSGLLSQSEDSFKTLLFNSQKGSLDQDDIIELIRLLGSSRFYHFAYLVTLIHTDQYIQDNSRVKEILQYYNYCRNVESISETYFQNIALNGLTKESRQSYYERLDLAGKEIYTKLNWVKKPKKFTKKRLETELYRRFGTVFKDVGPYYTSQGKTGLFFLAHTIEDDTIQVSQYGYNTDIHYVSLDFMYGNSFDGWFIEDNTARLGGWSSNSNSLIVQMRRAYSDRPLTMWNRITNKDQLDDWKRQIDTLSSNDNQTAIDNEIRYYEGVVNRMRLNACNALLSTIRESADNESSIKLEFLSQFEKLQTQSSILCHEGRHLIDNKFRLVFEPFCKKYEFRAKCSEIVFSDDPYFTLAFSPVYYRYLDANSKHAFGSRLAMSGLADWMEKHASDIEGYNGNKPALLQLDLLSNEQLLSAFYEMDPLSKKRNRNR